MHAYRRFCSLAVGMTALAGCLLAWTAGASAQEEDAWTKIRALEQQLAQKGSFDWTLHNELRHWYGAVDLRKGFHHCNVILQHSPQDDYMLYCLAFPADVEKDPTQAIPHLRRSATKYPEFSFVAAACWLKVGDLERTGPQPSFDRAAAAYRQVLALKGASLDGYRKLAAKQLLALGAERPADIRGKVMLAGNWRGKCMAGTGQSLEVELTVQEDKEGTITGALAGMPLQGQRLGRETFFFQATTKGRAYRVVAVIQEGKLALNYAVTPQDQGAKSYGWAVLTPVPPRLTVSQ